MGRKHCGKRMNSSLRASFSPSVFKKLALQTYKNQGLLGKGLKFIMQINVAGIRRLVNNCSFLKQIPILNTHAEENIQSIPSCTIRITSVNSTNQASDVCRRTTSRSDNNNPHSNLNNNMTTSSVFDFKQYEVDKM